MRLILAACLALAAAALAACYQSDRLLLDPDRAVTPLALGRQTAVDDGGQPAPVVITLGADHWYAIQQIDKADAPIRLMFVPLSGGPDGEWFAFALGQKGGFLYGVGEKRDGAVFLDLPFCDLGVARDIAIANGVKVEAKGAMSPVCRFERADDLAGALADYARRPGERAKLAKLPAGS
jgi:hypothetical protein